MFHVWNVCRPLPLLKSEYRTLFYSLTFLSSFSGFVCPAEQHRGATWAGLRRTHLLPRCVLLQERRRHPLRPRHLARVRGAGCGRALLRHLEIPLQGPQRRHPPPVVTTAGAGRRLSTFPLRSGAEAPARRLPQLPAEAAATAEKFTKIMTVNCLLFSNERADFCDEQKLLSKLFCTTSVGEGVLTFYRWTWHIHECLRNLIAVFCITWSKSHSTLGSFMCHNLEMRHPFQPAIWALGTSNEVLKISCLTRRQGFSTSTHVILGEILTCFSTYRLFSFQKKKPKMQQAAVLCNFARVK